MVVRFFFGLLLLALTAWPAAATASLTCTVEDRNLKAELIGNIGSDNGAGVQITAGEIVLKPVRGKYDAMTLPLEAGTVAQFWTLDDELRIGLHLPDKNDTSGYLAILTRLVKGPGDIARYDGRYVLRTNGPKGPHELKGRAKCDAG